MKRVLKGISLAFTALLLTTLPVLAAYTVNFSLTESNGTSYPMLPIGVKVNNQSLANQHYISASGLDTRVYQASTAVPHMLTDNATYFALPVQANQTMYLREIGGETPLSDFYVIPGYGGYIKTADNASLELGTSFEISVSGYFDMTAPGHYDKDILYKGGVVSMNVTAANTLTFHGLNIDDSDNWTMQATMASGEHTVKVASDGFSANMYVDTVLQSSQSLTESFSTVAGTTGSGMTNGYFPFYRPVFYAEGLWWLFSQNSTNMFYLTSADGLTWSAPTTVTTSSGTETGWGLWFDGTVLQYITRVDFTHSGFRRGTPQSDGSITWAAPEQSIAMDIANVTSICTNASGQTFIAYYRTTNQELKVIRNDRTDGTWVTAQTSTLNSGMSVKQVNIVGDHDSNQVFVVFAYEPFLNNGVEYGFYYNGANWDLTRYTLSTGVTIYQATVADVAFDNDDNVVVIYSNALASPTLYYNRWINGVVGTPIAITTAGQTNQNYKPTLTFNPTSNTVLFWYVKASNLDIYYKPLQSGILGAESLLVSTSAGNNNLAASHWPFGGNIGMVSLSGSNLVFAYQLPSWIPVDTSADYYWMLNNSMPYADNMTMKVSGVTKLQYNPISIIQGTTLPDQSGHGNSGNFTFGSAVSIGVTTNVTGVSAGPLAQAPPFHLGDPTGHLFPSSTATSNFGTGYLFHIIVAALVVLGASLSTSALMRLLGSGSLIIKTGIMVGTMGIFVAMPNVVSTPASGTWLDFWMIVFFLMMAVAIMMGSKQVSW